MSAPPAYDLDKNDKVLTITLRNTFPLKMSNWGGGLFVAIGTLLCGAYVLYSGRHKYDSVGEWLLFTIIGLLILGIALWLCRRKVPYMLVLNADTLYCYSETLFSRQSTVKIPLSSIQDFTADRDEQSRLMTLYIQYNEHHKEPLLEDIPLEQLLPLQEQLHKWLVLKVGRQEG